MRTRALQKPNSKELRRLRKKRFRAVAWFSFWLWFIPLGLIVCRGLAMLIPMPMVSAILGMGGLLAPFVGLVECS